MVREVLAEIVLRIAPVHREAVCVVERLAYRSAGELTGQEQLPGMARWCQCSRLGMFRVVQRWHRESRSARGGCRSRLVTKRLGRR
jgi:hypothetical protein